jgi:hypothetical protein
MEALLYNWITGKGPPWFSNKTRSPFPDETLRIQIDFEKNRGERKGSRALTPSVLGPMIRREKWRSAFGRRNVSMPAARRICVAKPAGKE